LEYGDVSRESAYLDLVACAVGLGGLAEEFFYFFAFGGLLLGLFCL